MAGLFLAVLSMSLTGSAVILAVLLARACLRRVPKKVTYLLWIPVAFRLICPVSFSSPLSLFRLPVLNAASEATHISAALTEKIDSFDDWASAGEPAQPLDFTAHTDDPAAPVPVPDEPVGTPGDMIPEPSDAPAATGEQAPSVQTGEAPTQEPVFEDPTGQLLQEETPAAGAPEYGPAQESSPETAEKPHTETAEPAQIPVQTTAPVPDLPEQAEGNAPENPVPPSPGLPEPDSSAGAEASLDRAAGVFTRILTAASWIWLSGIAVLLLYGVGSSIAIRRMMDTAVWREENVWESDRMGSPFILGLIRPKIYIPFGLEGDCRRYVLAHERYHLRCRDDLAKAAGWLILAVHWFNPLVWLAFHLMSRDMEMRCDEAVLSGEDGIAKAYSMSLLSFAAEPQIRFPVSPAFGERDVESRIRRILDWKKPKTWVSVLAGVLVLAVILVCTSDPVTAVPAAIGELQTEIEPERDGELKPLESLETDLFVPLGELPAGDWMPLTAERENVLYSTGGWMENPLRSPGSLSAYIGGSWNGWYREDGAFCKTSLSLAPYTRESFRWNGCLGVENYDFRGTYRIGEDGLLRAEFGASADADEKPYEAVFRIRYDAAHAYGTEYREVLGVSLVSCTAPGFEAWTGRELAMTGAAWFRGDLDVDPADGIVKMTAADREEDLFADAPLYETDSAGLAAGERLAELRSEYASAAVAVSDLGDLLFRAEKNGEDGPFLLTSFRWQGVRYDLPRPVRFEQYRFHLLRGEGFAWFTEFAWSGESADTVHIFLTEDGAYRADSAEAGFGYALYLWPGDGDGTVSWLRCNADILNMQNLGELLRFRGFEDDLCYETGSLRYDGDGSFVFASEERLTGSEWFEIQKQTYPASYPEDVFGGMTLSEYVSDYLPREIRDSTLRAKGLFTPEEAETISYHLIDGMSSRRWADGDFAFGPAQVQGFLMRIGLMTANAETDPFPETLSALWTTWPDGEGISRANACRIAEEMFGVFPSAPEELSSNLFRYDEAGDRFVVNPTGGSHGYFTMEDVSTVWDDVSVTVRFRLVTYVPDGTGQSAGIYADERIDFGEYRLIFYKPDGLYTRGLPRILFAKRGEAEDEDSPEPPVGEEVRNAIVYPDFFDEEQRDLYARATVFLPVVWGPIRDYNYEDIAPRKDGEPFLNRYRYPSVTAYDPERGVECTYFVCRGRYENWADLDAAGRSLFTGALWESVTGPGQRCMNYGGKTLFLDSDAGGNGYDPTLDRFELVEKTEDRITYWFITSYRARGTFEVESSERTLITMEKTAEGWRFASFRVGSWLPAGTTAEKTTVHVNTPEEAESLVRMLVRGVLDESWLEGRNSFTPTDAQYFTQGLKTAFSDAAFPFREAVLSPDGTAWTIHADHIRDAVKELFGIPDFDYIDAVRELYGDGADNSVSVDGLGFLSFPADIGDHTTKFDVSELFSYEEDGTVTVFARLVNASDYPWDEADYGIYCFKFQTDFDGPGLTVENTAVQWTRGEVEAEIARLMGQRTIAVNDMNNASARNVEIETEIHRLRSVLEDESSPGDDRRAAVQRLEDLEPLREQQYALEERCLEAVKQFAARIRMYEMILAKMDGGSYADDLLSARLRSLTAEDILCLGSSFDHITAEELAPILNRTGILGGQPAPEDFRAYYTLDVYLSELPSGGFGSESETLTLFAGLERDLVRILWSGEGTHKADERFVRDADLYRILRENYRLTEQIDADAFEKWGEAARERAAETVENTLGMDGSRAFTDYRIIYFVITDAFERDDAWYTVCSWRPVFLTDDPENVVWAGGMLLDADGRVYGAEVETYLVEKWTSSGTRTAFLLWDLYAGPDKETGIAWGRDRIVKAFEQLENEEDGIKQDQLLPYNLAPVFEEFVRTGLYKREITILGFEGDSAHKDEINEFLRQGEAVRQTYLNGVRDTEYPSPEWYDDWVLRISAGSAEAGDLLFLTVRTIHPSTYIDVPQYDTRILDRREDRLISLDEAVSALGFDVGARTAAAEKAFVGSIGGLREDQKFKYFEFRDFIALEGRLYERYEYDFYGVDFAQGWLEPVDAVPALTAEEADTLAADLSRYLRITEIDSASVPHDATIADETGLYFKVTDQQFASWDGWQSFVRNIFTEEAAQRILADPDGVMKEVSGFSFIRPGAGGGFDPNRYTCFARREEGRYKLIIVYSAPSEEDESGSLTLAFPLRYENGAWRVERMESESAHVATFNPAERTASSLDELPRLGLNESDARLRYIRAFVTGDVDTLELVCGVEKGMYADYRTLELSSWAVWIDPAEDRGPLRFAFVPTHSDVEAFPTDVRTEGTVYEGLIGAYLSRSGSSPSFGEAADELYDLLSNHILLDLPTTDEMDYPTRFALSCYICDKLGNTDLTEENIRDYAEKHFGIEDFTPDGAHVGSHGGHGGSHQFLDIVGSEEKDGETVVTVQYYADWSKTVNSGTWQYTMRKTDDGWSFTGSEEIRHSDYERARQVM